MPAKSWLRSTTWLAALMPKPTSAWLKCWVPVATRSRLPRLTTQLPASRMVWRARRPISPLRNSRFESRLPIKCEAVEAVPGAVTSGKVSRRFA
jgi:hypothetical protein